MVNTKPKTENSIVATNDVSSTKEIPFVKPTTSTVNYQIIVGCFRIEENATKFEAELKSKGFNASIAGKNKQGLTMVSASSFTNLSETENALLKIQSEVNSEAWVYFKN